MKNDIFFEESVFEEAKIVENLKKLGATTQKYRMFTKTELEINDELAKIINRKKGRYITFNIQKETTKLVLEIANTINDLVEDKSNVLVVGLGNRFVTADSLGENTLSKITLKNVLKFCPSVKSETNIDSPLLVKGVVDTVKPTGVIVIDSLATRDTSKLATSIQLTDAGIVAGGGVYKSDKLFSLETLKVPVIAVGVPLIVGIKGSFFCPHQIDIYVDKMASILAKSINKALK